MAELMVVGFDGTHRAAEVLDQVLGLSARWKIRLEDGVAVYRTRSGRLRLDQSIRATPGEGAALGGLLGVMLGALLAAPFTAGASAAVAASAVATGGVVLGATGALFGADDAERFKEESGLTEEFVRQVGGMIQPGQSAIFVVGETPDPEGVAERFRGYGGTVLKTTLPAGKAARVQRMLADKKAVPA